MLSRRGEPLFLADWMRVLMIHFEVDPNALQRDVPFQLDLRAGRAFVSLVAFTMENMRPRFGGCLAAWLLRPIATHEFLNVRTYVRHGDEPGIHFLAEWLPSPLAVWFGPKSFGLPYRYGRIAYQHDCRKGSWQGRVSDVKVRKSFEYRASWAGLDAKPDYALCEPGSLDEWLMERYTAFNSARGHRQFFRIWHPPWPQCRANVDIRDDSLVVSNWQWFRDAQLVGGNAAPGFRDVWMGRPHRA